MKYLCNTWFIEQGIKCCMLQYLCLLGNLKISTKWADNCVKYVPALMKSVMNSSEKLSDIISIKTGYWLDRQKMGFLRNTIARLFFQFQSRYSGIKNTDKCCTYCQIEHIWYKEGFIEWYPVYAICILMVIMMIFQDELSDTSAAKSQRGT